MLIFVSNRFLLDFILLSVSPDPQTPTTISVCDNPTAWLQRHIPDHQSRRRLREITTEKDESVSQVHHLTQEKRTFDREKEGKENEWYFMLNRWFPICLFCRGNVTKYTINW